MLTCANTSSYYQQVIHVSLPKDFDASRGVDISTEVRQKGQQNELNTDAERFFTHQSNLSCSWLRKVVAGSSSRDH